ncbi:MAG: TIGR03936 family radical SAM-associated protein [Oscillospiraceae bacterium]|jgi:radical SAM-linked protein
MPKHRLRFEKTGTAVYISHLDLMRTFQRGFQRAEISIRHTEGFNPHAFISIALPMSVGFSSVCERLDFECTDQTPLEEIPGLLNAALPDGVRVQACYEADRPFRELEYIKYRMTFLYDSGVPEGAAAAIEDLLGQEEILVPKKGKKAGRGKQEVETNIAPLIRLSHLEMGEEGLLLSAVLRAQEPGLNPRYFIKAMERYAGAFVPDFVRFHREEVYDCELQLFR